MKLAVANWKMNLTYQEEREWFNLHAAELAQNTNPIVLCPSALSLDYFNHNLKNIEYNNSLKLGAQGCSEHSIGAHTNQLSAHSLVQLGCSYVIIGHSEERKERNISYAIIAQQASRALEAELIPIICIGETAQEHQQNLTKKVITAQLEIIFKNLSQTGAFYFAYEPMWAIGSGEKPTVKELEEMVTFINTLTGKHAILYGGSVDEETVKLYRTIPHLSGFLIGTASLNFQKFKKIVSLIN